MANAKSHKLIDPDLHRQVAQDQQPRDAEHDTVYDDGTTKKTIHKLYYEVSEGEVRSCLIEDWPAEQQALAERNNQHAAYQASRQTLRTTAQGLVGQSLTNLSTHEVRDLFALFLEQEGLLDANGKVLRDRRFGPKQGWE